MQAVVEGELMRQILRAEQVGLAVVVEAAILPV
jgi:hypothetical protein